jgi:hypothetical protein
MLWAWSAPWPPPAHPPPRHYRTWTAPGQPGDHLGRSRLLHSDFSWSHLWSHSCRFRGVRSGLPSLGSGATRPNRTGLNHRPQNVTECVAHVGYPKGGSPPLYPSRRAGQQSRRWSAWSARPAHRSWRPCAASARSPMPCSVPVECSPPPGCSPGGVAPRRLCGVPRVGFLVGASPTRCRDQRASLPGEDQPHGARHPLGPPPCSPSPWPC